MKKPNLIELKPKLEKFFGRATKVTLNHAKKGKEFALYIDTESDTYLLEGRSLITFFQDLVSLCGATELDMPSHYETEGCETCGYGEGFSYTFFLW